MYSQEEYIDEIEENDLDIIDHGDDVEDPENLTDVNNREVTESTAANQEDTDKKVKPKRVIQNPQPKLNEQTLQGPKGLSAIPGYFDKVKFKGRGHEEEDLDLLLRTYEYWCHRLVPKFSFDDCIARLETLGSKKATQTQIKRIRMGIDLDNDDNQLLNEDEDHTAGFVDTTQDVLNNQFDQLLSNGNDSETACAPSLSEEQMERIRQNKERAQKLREERLSSIKEKVQERLQSSKKLIPQTNISSETYKNKALVQEIQYENEMEDEHMEVENILKEINSDNNTVNKEIPYMHSSHDELLHQNKEKINAEKYGKTVIADNGNNVNLENNLNRANK